MSKLNKDILFVLFNELQDDSKSLFSCLMVNRLWCETVVPILWKNPWCYNINYCHNSSLCYVIIFYLADDIKNFLTNQGIYLPQNLPQNLPQILRKPLLFDYLSFCKGINANIINSMISSWYSLDYTSKFLLKQKFYNILIRKCSRLKYLDMSSIEHQIFYFPEDKILLDSLCELKCDMSIDPSFFNELTCICQNIQRLIIINTLEKNYGIVKLIEAQNNLKYFEWCDNYDDSDSHFYDRNYDDYNREIYFYALVKNANTLKHLIISFQYIENYEHIFLGEILPGFHKLKTLKIDYFHFSSREIPKTLVYHNLEVININYASMETAACIIENCGSCLREILFLEEPHYCCFCYFDDDGSLILIRKIYENCPLVEYLSLAFLPSKEYFTELKKLLGVCQNLKSLLLLVIEETNESYKNGENLLLEILVESAPTNLKELRFNFKVSLEALETFLEKWKGRPALSMLTCNSVYNKEDYKNLINKYKHVGVIKDFRYGDIYC